MISWLQRSLQKHYKWLFTIMLAIIIVAFVFTIGGSPGIGRGRHSTEKQMYYGINLNNPEIVQELFQQTNLSHVLNTGQNITNNQVAENMALTRPILLSLADQLNIDHPNEYELAEYIKTKPLFKDDAGRFDPKKYEDFVKIIKKNPRGGEGLVRLVLSQDLRMDHVLSLMGGPGYVMPFEAELSLERQKTVWSIEVAKLDFADFNSNIEIPEDKLEEFYVHNKYNFATPARIEIAYVHFPLDSFISKVANPTEEELKKFYETHPLFSEDKEKKGDKVEKPLAEVKNQVIEAYKKERAQRLAGEVANDFQYELYQNHIAFNSDKLGALLKKHKLNLIAVPPFDSSSLPQNTPLPRPLLEQALTLNESRYYSDVATTAQGAYMVFFKKEIPVSIPPIEEIKKELKEQYIAKENLKLLESKAKVLSKTLQSTLKAGKDFKKVAEAEGLKVSSFNKFNILEAPKDLERRLLIDMQVLHKGDVSKPISQDDKVYFVYVKEKEVPTIDKNSEEVKSLVKQMGTLTSAIRVRSIINGLMTEGMQEAVKK